MPSWDAELDGLSEVMDVIDEPLTALGVAECEKAATGVAEDLRGALKDACDGIYGRSGCFSG